MSAIKESKNIFIGGITGGIGSALAEQLSDAGHQVGGYGRNSEKLQQLKASGFTVFEADATSSEELKKSVEAFIEKTGGLDVYVHCIGSVFLKPLHLTSDEDFEAVLATNLVSAFKASKAVIGPMRKQKSGLILLVSSVAVKAGLSNHEAIAAAKGGIEGLVKSIAATYAANGIRANAIAPGLVETPATAALTGNEQARAFSERMHPVGRLGKAGEVASLLAWMASSNGDWVTGQIFGIDGGMGSLVAKPRA